MTQDLPPPPDPAAGWAWFLDMDGTLIDIAPTPSGISIPVDLPPLLRRLSESAGGALALVSGRTLDNLRQLVAPFDPPAAGLHGLEWRDGAGTVHRRDVPAGLDLIRERLAGLARDASGLLLEDKGQAVALHYRQAPELAETARRAAEAAIADQAGYSILAGKMVYEIKPAGVDKGVAVRTFMTKIPFAGRRAVFVGDDVTDEYGFAAANQLGGLSVLVGAPRETQALYHLPDIESCRTWLAKAAGIIWNSKMGEGAD